MVTGVQTCALPISLGVEKAGHPAGVTRSGQGAGNDEPVVARQHAVAAMAIHLTGGGLAIVLLVWFRLCRLRFKPSFRRPASMDRRARDAEFTDTAWTGLRAGRHYQIAVRAL